MLGNRVLSAKSAMSCRPLKLIGLPSANRAWTRLGERAAKAAEKSSGLRTSTDWISTPTAGAGPAVLRPVTLPPGRERLSTSPILSGYEEVVITMGIVLVARFAARVA